MSCEYARPRVGNRLETRATLLRGVLRRHLRADGLPPCDELVVKFLGACRFAFDQIVLLSDVGRDVVELQPAVLEEFEELVVTATDGADGERAAIAAGAGVAGEVPVDRVAAELVGRGISG